MNILDLSMDSFSAIKAGIEEYEHVHPVLIDHYFQYWADRKNFNKNVIGETELSRKRILVSENLKKIKNRLSNNFNTGGITVILFVGQNTSNGHAFRHDDEIIVWIPVETYRSDLQAQIFLTHEILHGIHYASSPDFLFSSHKERVNLGRQLITEGIATYITMVILKTDEKTALWADYLSEHKINEWYDDCGKREKELREYCLKNFHNSSDDIELFYAEDPKDIFKYRAGYYIGIQFIKRLVRQFKNEKIIIEMRREKIEQLALQYLSG